MARPIPDGSHSVTPYLVVTDAARLIEFYRRALGAEELFRMPGPGGRIMHAEIKVGDSHRDARRGAVRQAGLTLAPVRRGTNRLPLPLRRRRRQRLPPGGRRRGACRDAPSGHVLGRPHRHRGRSGRPPVDAGDPRGGSHAGGDRAAPPGLRRRGAGPAVAAGGLAPAHSWSGPGGADTPCRPARKGHPSSPGRPVLLRPPARAAHSGLSKPRPGSAAAVHGRTYGAGNPVQGPPDGCPPPGRRVSANCAPTGAISVGGHRPAAPGPGRATSAPLLPREPVRPFAPEDCT